MPLTNDQVTELAREAVKKMFAEQGPDFKFPADVIWQNTPPGIQIPSTARPHQPKRLMKEGLLEKTGAMAKALSEARNGSSTAEYRFGPSLVSRTTPATPLPLANSTRASDLLIRLQSKIESEGFTFSVADFANFYLAMMVSPLVILSGISGTGKSLLPRKFAKHAGSEFKLVPVQPQWSDNSDLFGYVPTLSPSEFIEGALIASLVKAKENPSTLTITLLDEMNLAPVEHYFSDFLSIAETRRRDGGSIVTDPLPIELPKIPTEPLNKYSHLENLGLPHNLRVIGTANMDETTHSFSPKVLDRAFTIEFDDPDLTSFANFTATAEEDFSKLADLIVDAKNPISIQEAYQDSQALFDEVAGLLQEIQNILSPTGIRFGYRTRDAVLLYLHFWKQLGLEDIVSANAALDFCLLQKVLPKISGSGDQLANALSTLTEWLKLERTEDGDGEPCTFLGPFTRSQEKVERMASLLDVDGATHYWGT
ncbi:McrB family protein [Pseudomonas sp. C2B4]|uniref:McrB family protein n=1 Tax=Pseudomonas sp. C2B4 TaxID=2735270 RepID=UPI001586A921|nr:AAA family ATPase [Pseudomonas sp. C2B4]NUU35163.1 AAA domain-containing protein [Pseudomonas sp. C2B4]